MSTRTNGRATLADLHREERKAELIDGKIIRYPGAGVYAAAMAAHQIAFSLYDYAESSGVGEAYTGGLGYALPAPLPHNGRESFQADASYYIGPHPENPMSFIVGAPTFAVEVRNADDYEPGTEERLADKRRDYFHAGTRVVWDVDPVEKTVTVYRADAPERASVFRCGDSADAEPALPGWQLAVDEVFSE